MPHDRRRVGPLSAVATPEPALAFGDIALHHVRLDPRGLTLHVGDAPSSFVPWADIREIRADTPTTWWPSPAFADTAMALIDGLFGGGPSESAETPTFALRLAVADGETVEWRVTTRYLCGYRRTDAALAARLLDHLASRPEERILLAQSLSPAEWLARIPRAER